MWWYWIKCYGKYVILPRLINVEIFILVVYYCTLVCIPDETLLPSRICCVSVATSQLINVSLVFLLYCAQWSRSSLWVFLVGLDHNIIYVDFLPLNFLMSTVIKALISKHVPHVRFIFIFYQRAGHDVTVLYGLACTLSWFPFASMSSYLKFIYD